MAVTGSLTLLAGLVVVALSITVPAKINVRTSSLNEAVYVGANTCYTCHNDQPDGWSETLSPRLMRNSVIAPRTDIPILQTGQASEQIILNVLAKAYTSNALESTNQSENLQHYVIQTEAGDVLLGTRWTDFPNPPERTSASPDLLASCMDCHSSTIFFDTHVEDFAYFVALPDLKPVIAALFPVTFALPDIDVE